MTLCPAIFVLAVLTTRRQSVGDKSRYRSLTRIGQFSTCVMADSSTIDSLGRKHPAGATKLARRNFVNTTERIASLGLGRCPERRFEQPQTGSDQ